MLFPPKMIEVLLRVIITAVSLVFCVFPFVYLAINLANLFVHKTALTADVLLLSALLLFTGIFAIYLRHVWRIPLQELIRYFCDREENISDK